MHTPRRISSIISIAAGKGGVGKSMLTVSLAHALVARGAKVGIIDADLYGPSIGKMIEPTTRIDERNGQIVPAFGHGIYYVSLSQFGIGQEATIVRAPIANEIIKEFLQNVIWPDLDYLLIDFPPGTGDVQLTIMQEIKLTGAILVTTGQKIALLDVEKASQMFKKMQVPILGVIENMNSIDLGGVVVSPFGESHVGDFCLKHGLELIGKIPLHSKISQALDQGKPFIHEDLGLKRIFEDLATGVDTQLLKTGLESLRSQSFDLKWEGSNVAD